MVTTNKKIFDLYDFSLIETAKLCISHPLMGVLESIEITEYYDSVEYQSHMVNFLLIVENAGYEVKWVWSDPLV